MRHVRTFALAFGVVVLAGALFLGGYLLGDHQGQRAAAQAPSFDILYRVRDLLDREFYGDAPTTQAQAYAAATGLVQSYNDPFTRFIEPAPRKLEKAELQGQFGGIGALIGRNQAGEAVLTPNRGSPAMQAGIQAGDALVAVDDKKITPEMAVNDIVLLVRGDIGTKVKLTIRRTGESATRDVTIVRQRIETPSVDWRVLDAANHVGYLRITIFSERTAQEVHSGIDDLNKQGVTKLVLDLRGDGGGLLDAAIDTGSQFLRSGVILHEVKRGGAETNYSVKTTSSPAQDWPLVILTDGGTASASEILAGALHDYNRATLIGDKTFGKGSVQLVHELSDGSSLHVTVARWLTPNRHQIDKVGLQPDVAVPITEQDRSAGRDPQLDRALAWLLGNQG